MVEEKRRGRTEGAVPYWKIDDFLGFPGFSWVWVVLRAARAKKVETKRFYPQKWASIEPRTSPPKSGLPAYLTWVRKISIMTEK